MKPMESQTTSDPPAESQSGTPPARRLVIRVKIPKGTPPAPVPRPLNKGALLLVLGVVAVLLGWVGISMFRNEPTSAPAATAAAPASMPQSPTIVPAPIDTAPAKTVEPPPKPTAQPPRINEVIPNVPRSARETIRGTIRVSIRVIVDKEGAVIAATADEPGPSRYFERLATEAARKWTFTPADSDAERIMLVRFYFKRTGTTARASSPQ
jgi:TonB family protein